MMTLLILTLTACTIPAGVTGPEQRLNETRKVITGKALESLEQQYDREEYRFTISARWIPGSLLQADPEQILTVEPAGAVGRFTTFEVSRREAGRQKKVQVQFSVDMEQKLPVASRRLRSGEIITSSDLSARWVSVTGSGGKLAKDAAELEGMTIRRTLSAGQPVRQVDIGREYLIEAGDAVTLIFNEGGVRVELAGEARQSGAESEEIRIYSNETRKRYRGRIKSPGIVIWQQTL